MHLMGLSTEDIKNNHLFPYFYLQRAGAGSRYLCLPSVKEGFQWCGKKVATLSKPGSFIYLLADADLPGWRQIVSSLLI